MLAAAALLLGCPGGGGAPDAGGLPVLHASVERVVSSGLPEAAVDVAGLLRLLDDGRVVSPVDTGAGVIGALRVRAPDGTVTAVALPAEEAGGQFSFFEDERNYGGWHDAPARGWAVLDGGLREYLGAGGRPRGRLPDGTVVVELAGAVRGQTRLVRWRPGPDAGPDLVDARESFADLAFVRFVRLARDGTLHFAGRGGADGEQGEPVVLRSLADGGFEAVDLHPPAFSFSGPNDGLVEPACCQVADVAPEGGAILGLLEGRPAIRRGATVEVVDPERGTVGRLNGRGDVLYETREPRMRFQGTRYRFDPAATWGGFYPELAGRPVLQAVELNGAGQLLLRPTAGSAYLVTPSLTEVLPPAEVLTFRRVSGTAAIPDALDLATAQVALTLTPSSLSLAVTATAASGQKRVLTVLLNGASVRTGAVLGLQPTGGSTVSVSYVDRVVGVTAVGSGQGTIEVLAESPARVRLVDVELAASGSRLAVSGPVSQR